MGSLKIPRIHKIVLKIFALIQIRFRCPALFTGVCLAECVFRVGIFFCINGTSIQLVECRVRIVEIKGRADGDAPQENIDNDKNRGKHGI